MRLPRSMRMKSRGEFSRVRSEGKSYGGRYLVLGVLGEPALGVPFKYGVILTRKVGNAVTRNTVALTILDAGVKDNVVPGAASATLNARLPCPRRCIPC